jgi:two-component system phosphate regulon sensor histidine kinase PhoR
MSETGRTAKGWRGTYIGLSAAAIAVIVAVAVAGTAAIPVAFAGAAVMLGLALYFESPRRNDPGVTRALPAPDLRAGLPAGVRAILECLDDPLLVLDAAGRVVFANSASQAVVGGDWERKHISAVLRTPEVLEAVDRILQGGGSESVAFSFLVPMTRHYQAYIVRSQDDGRLSVLIHISDLTAMRRAEELRADFVANASHELRTPLAAVSGFIDTLRGHAKDDSQARERFLEIMSVEAGRMRRLIDDLLSLTRIELNEHNPPGGEVDIVAVVRDAADALAPLAESDRTTIHIAPEGALSVVGDRDELTQVFQNLLHNAIKYGRAGGKIRVSFGRAEAASKRDGSGQIFVSIQDEGEGIPREAIPRLTERFYRVDVRKSRERGGTGLGLAIVKHILNRHHGRLHVESTPGEGSTFTVFLPEAPPG